MTKDIKPPEPRAPFPPRLEMEVFACDNVHFATEDTPRKRLVVYVPEALVAAARSEARAEAFEEAAKLLDSERGTWIPEAPFGEAVCSVLEEYAKKLRAKVRLPGKGVERPGEEK